MTRRLDQDVLWTRGQRRGLIGLLGIFTLVLAVRYFMNRAYIPSPQPAVGLRAAELATQLDPNVATWEELAAIPGVGEKRAKAIVAFREQALKLHPEQAPFARLEDLMHVKGIASATAENLKPYLIFSPTRPAAAAR